MKTMIAEQDSVLANRLSLATIQQPSQPNRWRTEAMRSHPTPRLIFFSKGQGRITISGLTSGYGPNNLIYIPAHTMYGYEVGAMVFGYTLSIPGAMASDWPEESVHLRIRDVLAQKELVNHIDALERELNSDKQGHSRAAHYLLGMLSVFFERQMAQAKEQSTADRKRSAPARLVAAYSDLVERDFTSGKGVSDYAAELGVTPTHLTRCCNQTCGKSALAFLHDRILYEARVLLRDTKNACAGYRD